MRAIAIIEAIALTTFMSNPELSAVSFAQKPANRGPVVKLPTIGNVYLNDPIVPGGNFCWYEATHGGARVPDEYEIVEGIINLARKLQPIRAKLKKPIHITSWYRPGNINAAVGGARDSRHLYGDAVDFWVDGLMGYELYDMLDSTWDGGLGQYQSLPYIIHLDARGYQSRW